MATLLNGRLPPVARILHSGKTRARQTAEILARGIAASATVEQADGMNPLDDPETFRHRIAASADDVMLVGHLPFMARLASRLLGCDLKDEVVAFEPGTVLCLEGDGGAWRVAWMLRPELLGPGNVRGR